MNAKHIIREESRRGKGRRTRGRVDKKEKWEWRIVKERMDTVQPKMTNERLERGFCWSKMRSCEIQWE